MWRLCSVKYLLGPTSFEKQLPTGAALKVFAYDLAGTRDNEFQVIPNPKGAHAVFELLGTAPRYALIAGYTQLSDYQALARIADSRQSLLGGQGMTGTVEVVNAIPGKVTLKTSAEIPTMLRVAERWDPDWKAKVDNKEAEVERIDYLCQGVKLLPGEHTVSLVYAPPKWFFYTQLMGLFILLMTGFSLFLRRAYLRQ
jgi:hypothetical protein